MKTVVAIIKKTYLCPVAVSVPDEWDNATVMQRLGTPDALHLLDAASGPAAWEASESPGLFDVYHGLGPGEPMLVFEEERSK